MGRVRRPRQRQGQQRRQAQRTVLRMSCDTAEQRNPSDATVFRHILVLLPCFAQRCLNLSISHQPSLDALPVPKILLAPALARALKLEL